MDADDDYAWETGRKEAGRARTNTYAHVRTYACVREHDKYVSKHQGGDAKNVIDQSGHQSSDQ
jgi:hypothetical protein